MTAKTIARRAEAAKYAADEAAFQAKIARLNAAIHDGAYITITTHSGEYIVDGVRSDCWFVTHRVGTSKSYINQVSWCCHGGDVDAALRQIG